MTVNTPIIISSWVAELEPTKQKDTYRISLWSASEFGEDKTMRRTFYEDLIKGYQHACVSIEGMEDKALALLPPPGVDFPAYVEVDELSNPIPVSEEGLEAVRAVESLLLGGTQDWNESLSHIINAASNEKPSLKMALFERLREYFIEAEESKTKVIPTSLFELLPWELFNTYLERLTSLIKGRAKRNAETIPLTSPLPDLKYYFGFVRRGLAYELTTMVEKFEMDVRKEEKFDYSLIDSAYAFIDELWHAKLERIPLHIRKRMPGVLDTLANNFLRDEALPELKPEQLTKISVAKMRANLWISRSKKLSPEGLNLRNRLGNVLKAAVAADKGRLFEEQPPYIEPLCREIQETVALISNEPYRLSDILANLKEGEKFDPLLNAADVHRFYAQILFHLNGKSSEALKTLEDGETYYKMAEERIPFVPKPRTKRLLYQRYARALILKGEIYGNWGEIGAAKEALGKAITQLDNLRDEDYGRDKGLYGLYAHHVLKAEALIAQVEKCGVDGSVEDQIEQLLKKLVSIDPRYPKAYDLLYEYYYNVKRDFSKALSWMDQWFESWKRQKKWQKSVDWLQYRAARDCARAAEYPSLMFEAVERYAQVLRDQPRNTDATSDLIDFLEIFLESELEKAFYHLDTILKKIEEPDCPLTHALIRILFFADKLVTPEDVGSAASALLVCVKGPAELLATAKEQIVMIDRKQLSFIFEIMSKWYFNIGRKNPFKTDDLVTAGQLVDIYLSIEEYEPIFLTRKLDIAMQLREWQTAEEIVSKLERVSPTDPIVALKAATLKIKQGELPIAKKILKKAITFEDERAHPALIDRLAYIAFREGDFQKAEKLYEDILQNNQYDAIARFGLGRVYFEWGQDCWIKAFDEWLWALRIRIMNRSQRNLPLTVFTARCIASLCQQRPRDTDTAKQILSALDRTIRLESSEVSSLLVNSFAALGIVGDEGIVTTVREASRKSMDVMLVRRVAQYLMARTIYLVLGNEKAQLRNEVAASVRWCLEKNVLPEYLAGAKGSYERALLRLSATQLDEIELSKSLNRNQVLEFQNLLDEPLRNLYNHICSCEYSPDYYRVAYELFKNVGTLSNDDLLSFTEGLVKGVTFYIWDDIKNRTQKSKSLLERFSPTISLWPLRSILQLQDGPSQVGGWVDKDALCVIQQEFEGDTWQVVDSNVQREILRPPEKPDISLYGKAGIFFRQELFGELTQKFYCYIETLTSPDIAGERSLEAERFSALTG